MFRLVVVIGTLPIWMPSVAAGTEEVLWGGGRVFFQGHEISPPVGFSGFGGPVLYANEVAVDPLPCALPTDSEPDHWCGTTDEDFSDAPWRRRLAQQDYATRRLLALSSLPLVMVGCDYFYCPRGDEADSALSALDAGDLEALLVAGAPRGAIRDLELARAPPTSACSRRAPP